MSEAVARAMGSSPGILAPEKALSLIEGVRQGHLEVRLARTEAEIRAAQALRYRVFYDEMKATPSEAMLAVGRDFDRFDPYCEHLLVLTHAPDAASLGPELALAGGGQVIGTYRLLRRANAGRAGGFYTATEFDISPLEAVPGEILELGRACVHHAFRSRPTMQLLWRGISTFAVHHDVKVMFGCASLPGTDPSKLARLLSYLHYHHLAPPALRARALPHRYVRNDLVPLQDIDAEAAVAELDRRAAARAALPPLIKGYLRLGGMIGDGSVIDPDFRTIDVCIIVATDQMVAKYFNHFIRQPLETNPEAVLDRALADALNAAGDLATVSRLP